MGYKFIDDILIANGFQAGEFDLLRADESEYDLLLMQPSGEVEAGPDGVGPSDNELIKNKFTNLFEMAGNSQPDLVFTPEYACPWNALEAMLETDIWPAPGKLWILGFESISPENLSSLIQRQPSISWIKDQPRSEREQNFLSAVCFLFTAQSQNGENCPVIVLQFKQKSMADNIHEIEVNHMVRGNERVIFRNHNQSIHLAVLICAEALNFDFSQELPQSSVLPYMILHPQLNPNPRHPQFREYRDYWGNRSMDRIEIVSLNWARGTQVLGNKLDFGGSTWYFKSNKTDTSDQRIDLSHKKGFYYSRNRSRHYHCYIFNYDECVLHLRNLKVWQIDAAAAAQRDRRGPQVVHVYSWDSVNLRWHEEEQLDDGFKACCAGLGINVPTLEGTNCSPTNKERLVCLSTANIQNPGKKDSTWFKVHCMPTFELNGHEVCQRIAFCHDPDPDSRRKRERLLNRFNTLVNEIIRGGAPFPNHFRELRINGQLTYPIPSGDLNFNICTPTGKYPATFVYIGDSTEEAAKRRMNDIVDCLRDTRRHLVVWFRENGQLKYIFPEGLIGIGSNLTEGPKSFLRD